MWTAGGVIPPVAVIPSAATAEPGLQAPQPLAAPLSGSDARHVHGARHNHALRPVVVATSLGDLHGPVDGLVELPQRLFWSGGERVFDLGDCDRLLEMYEVVFDAARAEADLAEYLNGERLARVWPELALAPRVRRAWESAHPGLAGITVAA